MQITESKLSSHSGIETWGKNRRELRGKRSKTELITQIGDKFHKKVIDLYGLTLKDLKTILETEVEGSRVTMPTGRLKKPYIEELSVIFPEVKDFTKLSVSGLVSLLEAVIC